MNSEQLDTSLNLLRFLNQKTTCSQSVNQYLGVKMKLTPSPRLWVTVVLLMKTWIVMKLKFVVLQQLLLNSPPITSCSKSLLTGKCRCFFFSTFFSFPVEYFKFSGSVVFQAENIWTNGLDLPTRTAKDYQEPVIAPTVVAALEDALRDEDEIQVDASDLYGNWGRMSPSSSRTSLKTPKSG